MRKPVAQNNEQTLQPCIRFSKVLFQEMSAFVGKIYTYSMRKKTVIVYSRVKKRRCGLCWSFCKFAELWLERSHASCSKSKIKKMLIGELSERDIWFQWCPPPLYDRPHCWDQLTPPCLCHEIDGGMSGHMWTSSIICNGNHAGLIDVSARTN